MKKESSEQAGNKAANGNGELHEFVVEFRKYKTELSRKYLNRKPWEPKDDSKILSFIPGTITKIYVEEGQHVEEGDPLMILEAMKMKNTVFAEFPCVIRKIHVKEGEKVPKAMVVFEIDID
jgi:biotin carboxyl carrier protein